MTVGSTHRCTVVENPGRGGPWGFGHILFRGVLGVVRKSRGVHFFCLFFVFYCIFMWLFFGPYPPPSYFFLSFPNIELTVKNIHFQRNCFLKPHRILSKRTLGVSTRLGVLTWAEHCAMTKENDKCMYVTHEKITYVAGSGNIGKNYKSQKRGRFCKHKKYDNCQKRGRFWKQSMTKHDRPDWAK